MTIRLRAERPPGRGRALYEEIKARVLDGTYPAGSALPSTRDCAAERGLSRTTVSAVYEQLAAEGFIVTRAGAASRVAEGAMTPVPGRPATATARSPASAPARGRPAMAVAAEAAAAAADADVDARAATRRRAGPSAASVAPAAPAAPLSAIGARIARMTLPPLAIEPDPGDVIDFLYGPLAGTDFPSLAWAKATRQVQRERPPRLGYGDPRGDASLRRALQGHLARARGLWCRPEQLVVVNGSQQALDLCARLLVDAGDTVVVEDPGYRMAHHVFEAAGARLCGIPVDAQGLRTELLEAVPSARLAFVTPTHQLPLGAFLTMSRRHALIDWAARRGAWIVEDDYDSEYRYAVRPEPTLVTLDPHQRTLYVGTVSKTLSPQLRLGYLVLPPSLVEVFARAKRLQDRHAPTGPQQALATMLESGQYERHVRRMRRQQQARREALLAAIATHLGDAVTVTGAASGLHLVLHVHGLPATREDDLAQAALQARVRVHPLGPFHLPGGPVRAAPRAAAVVLGYALHSPARIELGIRRLARAIDGLTR